MIFPRTIKFKEMLQCNQIHAIGENCEVDDNESEMSASKYDIGLDLTKQISIMEQYRQTGRSHLEY